MIPTGSRRRMRRGSWPSPRTARSSRAMPLPASWASAQGTSNPMMTLAGRRARLSRAIAQALSQLRLVGVNGPYSVLLGADAYTALERDQRSRLSGARACQAAGGRTRSSGRRRFPGAFVLTTRGGDFDLHIGQDVSIGYLSHTDRRSALLEETFTFLLLTTEAAVALNANKSKGKG